MRTIRFFVLFCDLFYLINLAEEYILQNIHIGMKLEGLRRIDVPEIDRDAFREAIINAFCHRDYYKYDSVNIAIFKDRVEIRSPGLLYGNLTITRIKKEMVSERRNEIIADMFHRIHFIEKWGRGIRLIIEREPETDFKEVGTHFITVFKRKYVKNGEVIPAPEKDTVKDTVRDTVKILSKTERNIIHFILRNPKMTSIELSKLVKINLRNVKKNIANLKTKGLIIRVGPDKGGHWEIIK